MGEQNIIINKEQITAQDIIVLCKDIIEVLQTEGCKNLTFCGFHVCYNSSKKEVDLYPTFK